MNYAIANASTFRAWRAWLEQQLHRQGAVGDFACDYLADDCARHLHTLSGLDRHLRDEHGADSKVLDARDRAWREWQEVRWRDGLDRLRTL